MKPSFSRNAVHKKRKLPLDLPEYLQETVKAVLTPRDDLPDYPAPDEDSFHPDFRRATDNWRNQ